MVCLTQSDASVTGLAKQSWRRSGLDGETDAMPTTSESDIGAERAIIGSNMPTLRVQIVRFVEAYQPGAVECQFVTRKARFIPSSVNCPTSPLRTSGSILNTRNRARWTVEYWVQP